MKPFDDTLDCLAKILFLVNLLANADTTAGTNSYTTSSSRHVNGVGGRAARNANGLVSSASNLDIVDPSIVGRVHGDITQSLSASTGNGVARVGPGDANASSTRPADDQIVDGSVAWPVRGPRRRRDGAEKSSKTDYHEEEKTASDAAEDEAQRDKDAKDLKSVAREEEEDDVDDEEEDSELNEMKRDSQARDVSYDYIFGSDSNEDTNEDSLTEARRDSGTSEDEKAEDLAMSKELVNILIKEVYNKLMKSGVAVPQARNSVENKPVQAPPSARKVSESSNAAGSKGEKLQSASAKSAKGGKGKGNAKPHRHRRAADLPTTSGAKKITDEVESALFCHVLKKLAADKVVESPIYDGFIAKKVCFNRRFRRETGCDGCERKSRADHPTIIAEVTCSSPGYLRLFPSVQVVHDGQVVRDISLGEFRATGGYTMDGFTPKDINNNRMRGALQFTFQQPVEVIAFRFVQTRPHDKASVGSLWIALELAGEPNVWTSILDSVTKQALIMVVTSPLLQLPKPFTVTRIRIYPQSWPEARDQPVLPLPVFIACHPATSDSATGWSLVPVDKYDSWGSVLAAIFVN